MIESVVTEIVQVVHDPHAPNAASNFASRIAAMAATAVWKRRRSRRRRRRTIDGETGTFRWRWKQTELGRALLFEGRGEPEQKRAQS